MAREQQGEKLVFYSKQAFYPIHWEAFKYLCANYRVSATLIANTPPEMPTVHQQLGCIDPKTAAQEISANIRLTPEGNKTTKVRWLRQQLEEIQPDAIWVQEEPTDYFLLQILRMYLFNPRPRIVAAVCENIFSWGKLPHLWLLRPLLWSRLDSLLAVANPSIEGIRSIGMPSKVSTMTLVAGALLPPEDVKPMPLPFSRTEGDFVIGFVGRICEEKGWKVLLAALLSLPECFKCWLAGDGSQVAELQDWISQPALQGRVFYAGLLPKADLWSFYRSLDCLVVPSLTFPRWKEQFGGVLADAMAMGLPIIGSDSGAIPEVVGPAGLITPEGNAQQLADALHQIYTNPDLRKELSAKGKSRFDTEFSIPAYASKIAQSLRL